MFVSADYLVPALAGMSAGPDEPWWTLEPISSVRLRRLRGLEQAPIEQRENVVHDLARRTISPEN